MAKIKSGDEIVVLAGKDKGKRGKVQRVLGERLVVEGVQLVKKHQRPNPATNAPGGIVEQAAPIHASNVAIFNAVTGKADRVGYKVEEGKKVRVFKSNGAPVDL